MLSDHKAISARVGDWIEARGIHGEPARSGEIVEVLGREGHEHYLVRWDEQHESILYPADGVVIVRRRGQRSRRGQPATS